jgi:hypothetical protein
MRATCICSGWSIQHLVAGDAPDEAMARLRAMAKWIAFVSKKPAA